MFRNQEAYLRRILNEYITFSNIFLNYTTLEALEGVQNEILKSIKLLLDTFNNMCAGYGSIVESKSCVSNHIEEIEQQTE